MATVEYARKYGEWFGRDGAAAKHLRKFGFRIDRMRHEVELRVLRRYASGRLFDASVGIGRFIGHLPRVDEYVAQDFSEPQVEYIRETYPEVRTQRGDLLVGIAEPDDAYDTVLCTRTLHALPAAKVFPELARITRPGGLILVTFPLKWGEYVGPMCEQEGEEPERAAPEDLEAIGRASGVVLERRVAKDTLLVPLKVSRNWRRFLLWRWVPDSAYILSDLLLSRLMGGRAAVWVLRKTGTPMSDDPTG